MILGFRVFLISSYIERLDSCKLPPPLAILHLYGSERTEGIIVISWSMLHFDGI